MRSHYTKLFIIGNGFDRWQGLPTSYDSFKEYYRSNIRRVARELHIQTSVNAAGELITPVEQIFGDIFKPKTLPEEFFWKLEASMAMIDDQYIIDYFDKSDKGLYKLRETIGNAEAILQKIFGDWISSIDIEPKDTGYRFDESCYFINFNYTDTLEKRFGIDEGSIYHIHGEADDPESIIVGHSTHPETAFRELMEQRLVRTIDGKKSKRLQGLYLVEDALYETDKHVQDNIDELCEFMALDGVHIEDITDIYVLGHSFAETDHEYFDFSVKATQKDSDLNELSALWKVQDIGLDKLDDKALMEFIQFNIVYATQHRIRELQKEDIHFPREEMIEEAIFGCSNIYTDGDGKLHKKSELDENVYAAVHKRFLMEQALRTKEVIEELCLLKGVRELPSDCLSVLKAADHIDGGHAKRAASARWHISYLSDADKRQIEKVMQQAGCKEFTLYHGIDSCISDFK